MHWEGSSLVQLAFDWKSQRLYDPRFATAPQADFLLIMAADSMFQL